MHLFNGSLGVVRDGKLNGSSLSNIGFIVHLNYIIITTIIVTVERRSRRLAAAPTRNVLRFAHAR